MEEALQKSNLKICEDSSNAISLRESGYGRWHFETQEWVTPSIFGLEAVLASRFQTLDTKKRKKMSAICGQNGLDSLESVILQESLENKLRQRLDSIGSTLYNLTWKAKTTPLGKRYLEHQALANCTEDTDFFSLPTLAAREGKDWARASLLARLSRGDGVAKKICLKSQILRSSEQKVGLNPSFGRWMMTIPPEWELYMPTETRLSRRSQQNL